MNLLINADDFGISDSVNLAIDYCMKFLYSRIANIK